MRGRKSTEKNAHNRFTEQEGKSKLNISLITHKMPSEYKHSGSPSSFHPASAFLSGLPVSAPEPGLCSLMQLEGFWTPKSDPVPPLLRNFQGLHLTQSESRSPHCGPRDASSAPRLTHLPTLPAPLQPHAALCTRHVPTSGPLHWLFPLSTWFTPSPPMENA